MHNRHNYNAKMNINLVPKTTGTLIEPRSRHWELRLHPNQSGSTWRGLQSCPAPCPHPRSAPKLGQNFQLEKKNIVNGWRSMPGINVYDCEWTIFPILWLCMNQEPYYFFIVDCCEPPDVSKYLQISLYFHCTFCRMLSEVGWPTNPVGECLLPHIHLHHTARGEENGSTNLAFAKINDKPWPTLSGDDWVPCMTWRFCLTYVDLLAIPGMMDSDSHVPCCLQAGWLLG